MKPLLFSLQKRMANTTGKKYGVREKGIPK